MAPDLEKDTTEITQADLQESFTLGPEVEAVLLEAIAEADRGELVSGDELLRELGRG